MNAHKQLVTVLIPCYNEAAGIGAVVRSFYKSTLAKESFNFDILVVDNASDDGTAEVATSAGARVISEPQKGKGNAVRTGLANLDPDAKYVIMIDGDDTYRPEEVLRMLEPLYHGFCDCVVGSRLGGRIHGDSMNYLNRAGNWGFTHLTRVFYQLNVTDVLSGYFAWKREIIDELAPELQSHGFSIEMEMLTKMARLHYEVYSVPISYYSRKGDSDLRPFHDGLPILMTLTRNLRWHKKNTNNHDDERYEETVRY